MKVIIAEKRSLAKSIASALHAKLYPVNDVKNTDIIVCHAHGHLMELIYMNDYFGRKIPWGEELPFFPDSFRYRLKSDKGDQKLFKDISKLINDEQCDEIICAGDADREGEVIVRLILKYGLKKKKNITRLWLPSQTEKVIREQMACRKPDAEYDNLYNEGIARSYMDWLIGINLSRAVSSKVNTNLPIGRVLCPIVLAIYQRDKEIKDFVPKPYFSLESKTHEIKLISSKKFEIVQEDSAQMLCNDYNSKQATVISIENKTNEKQSPKLFSLSKLQGVCGKKLKLSPQKTLSTAQSLYEKGLVTYPRTNTEYLAESEKEKVHQLLSIHGKDTTVFKDSKRIFDDSKIESHSALMPTEKSIDSSIELSDTEKKIYKIIVNRFLCVFWKEPCLVSQTVAVIEVGNQSHEKIELKGSSIQQAGWMSLDGIPESESMIPPLSEGQVFNVDFKLIQKQTNPPKSYTVETLGNYLIHPFKKDTDSIDEEYKQMFLGCEIGTEATRAGIIDKAIRNEYISLKNNVYHIEKKGIFLAETLKKLHIDMSANQTVDLQKTLKKVYRNEITVEESLSHTKDTITEAIKTIKSSDIHQYTKEKHNEPVGICPWCHEPIYMFKSKYGTFYCHKKEDNLPCLFSLNEKIKLMGQETTINSAKAILLLNNKKASFSLISKAGKTYTIQASIKDKPFISEKGKAYPDFDIEFSKTKK